MIFEKPDYETGPRVVTAGPARLVQVTWQLSGHAGRLVTMAIGGLFLAVLTRRAEFAGLAAPALLLLTPWQRDRPAAVELSLADGAGLITEGDQGQVAVRITGHGDYSVRVRLRPAAWITAGPAVAGDDGWFRLPFRAEHWGTRQVGLLEVVLRDPWRLAEGRFTVGLPRLTCYPLPARLESLVVLSKLPARLGEHRARAAGEGNEFAGVREFVPGDRQRRINWPATTRRGTLQLNTYSAERAQVVVVLADVSSNVGEAGLSSADLAVRGAAGTTAAYLAARDRVGLISYGQLVNWVAPGTGRRQMSRITGLLLTSGGDGVRIDAVTRLPRAALPPGALLVVFSPLLSLPLVETLRELRERGHAVLVVDVLCAEPDPGRGRGRGMADLARRLWRMEQEAIRFSLREIGIPVVGWDGTTSLDEPLAPYTRRVMVTRG
jgi:uncharacterized protein (DUF58 family)